MSDVPPSETTREGAEPFLSAPTEREQPPATGWPQASTQREQEGPAVGETQREGAGLETGAESWSPLPPPLTSRFEFQAPLARRGTEAVLYRVRDRDRNELRVVKLYHFDTELREDALRVLQDTEVEHVVRLFEYGRIPQTGQWYEVQEHVEGGTLLALLEQRGQLDDQGRRTLAPELIHTVVEEINAALASLHKKGLFHNDIKPENVLFRQGEQLDLVLADFGLAAVSSDEIVFSTRRDGTPHYLAPEVMAKQGGAPRDYWALGMVVAVLGGGRHPFQELSEHAILDYLHRRVPIDLSSVAHERIRHLCSGLLLYDTNRRWRGMQVEQWLAGGSPEVAADAPPTQTEATGGIRFKERTYGDRRELAAALAANWADAARLIAGQFQREVLIRRLRTTFLDDRVAVLLDGWAAGPPPPDRAVAELVVALDPDIRPATFRGFVLDDAGVGALAREAIEVEGDARRAVSALHEHRILEVFALLHGRGHLRIVGEQWWTAAAAFDEAIAAAEEASDSSLPVDSALARARLLLATVDEGERDRLAAELDNASSRLARSQHWFAELSRVPDNEPGRVLAALVSTPLAARLAKEARAREMSARRERLREGANVARHWLRWVVAGNLLLAVGLFAAWTKRQAILDWAAEGGIDAEYTEWIQLGLDVATFWAVPSTVGVIGFGFWRLLANTSSVLRLRAAQGVALVGSVTCPLLFPFGMRHAFRTQARRSTAPPSRLRWSAVAGSLITLIFLLALWIQSRYGLFQHLLDWWPPGVASWYFDHWPEELRPETLVPRLPGLAPIGLLSAAAGLSAAWASYTHGERPEVYVGQVVAICTGTLAGTAGLPVLLSGVAGLAIAAFFVAAAILFVVVAFWMLGQFFQ